MKQVLTVFLLLAVSVCSAQTPNLQQGKKAFVVAATGDAHEAAVRSELIKQLKEWGYWQITAGRKQADLILHLEAQTHRGVTAWSWGGITTKAYLRVTDKEDQTVWQSRHYKANPNGTNGFNTAKATITRIVKEMKVAAAKIR